SSRRRHTRSYGDWSSDVCSSDLIMVALESAYIDLETRIEQRTRALSESNQVLNGEIAERKRAEQALRESEARLRALSGHLQSVQIGRASCRERVKISVWDGGGER